MAWTKISVRPHTWRNDDDSWRIIQAGPFFVARERMAKAVDAPNHKKLGQDGKLVDDPGSHNVIAHHNRDSFRSLADAQAACDAGDMSAGLQSQRAAAAGPTGPTGP